MLAGLDGICSVDQAGLSQDLPASAASVLGLKACPALDALLSFKILEDSQYYISLLRP